MGDRQSSPEAEKTEEPEKPPEEPEKPLQEPAKVEEPAPPGDPKKEWPIALAIMVFIALMSWAFISMLRPG